MQGRWNYFEVEGEGKRLPILGSKVTPIQNEKFPVFGPLFFGK